MLKTLYAKKLQNKNVQIYYRSDGTGLKCTFPWLTSSPPNKNTRKITINCFDYLLEWI